jgi:predicted aspartyl protease
MTMSLSRRSLLAVIPLGAGLAGPALAADEPLKLLIRNRYNRLLTPVWINAKGPIDFGIDTGAAIYTIDQSVATQMKLPLSSKVAIRGIVDPAHLVNPALQQVTAREVLIGGAFRDSNVDLALVGFGGDSVSGFVPGTMFVFAPTLLDFPGERATIYTSGRPDLAGFSSTRLFIITREGAGTTRTIRDPHLPIDVQLDGQTYRMVLDTGFPGLVSLSPETVRDRGLWASTPAGIPQGGGGLTGGFNGKMVRMKALAVAGHTLERPTVELIDPASSHSSRDGTDGLIGMEFLRRFDIAIDANAGSIAFRPNGAFHQAIRYNRSGMEIGSAGVVRHLLPGGPAERGAGGGRPHPPSQSRP